MRIEDFPEKIQPYLIPKVAGDLVYRCLGCGEEYDITELLYTCPDCGSILLLVDRAFDRLKQIPSVLWRQIFDYRRMLNISSLKGIYRYYEFIGPVIPLDA
ncbi:MAG: threonine synthase, partial [Deltaproteobacteria bacterium]|nr:threonine synthase [Deltaproteobacteria bacterium]